MNHNHPAAPDPDEALIRRVADRQSAHLSRRLGIPVVVPWDQDPALARRRVGFERDAMTVALWALRRNGVMVPDAIDAAGQRCADCGVVNLPIDVALAVLHRVHGTDLRADLRTALAATLTDWKRRDGHTTRAHIELAVWRLTETARAILDCDGTGIGPAALTDAIADELTIYAGMP